MRLELQQLRVVVAGVNGKRRPLQHWTTRGGTEFLVQHQRRLYLLDARQGLIFQLTDAVHEQIGRSFELLFPFPAPQRDGPVDNPPETYQLPGGSLEMGKVLLPADSQLDAIFKSNVGGEVFMPNLQIQEYREVFRIAFTVGEDLLEVFLEKRPE